MTDDAAMSAPRPIAGMLAGLGAGLVAAMAMNGFQRWIWAPSPTGSREEPATVAAARRVAAFVTVESLPPDRAEIAGGLMHYGLGAVLGVGYGLAAEYRPRVTRGLGLPFGTVVAIVLDEAAVPALGLARPFWRYPAGTHLYSLVSHLVFGAVTDGTRRIVLRLVRA